MVSAAIFLILVISFLIGVKRGFIIQFIHLTGFFISLYVAYRFYQDFANYIRLWIPFPSMSDGIVSLLAETMNLETIYYQGIAFLILLIGTKIVMRIVGSMLHFVAQLPFLRSINSGLGGILCFVEYYLFIFIFLQIGMLIPVIPFQSELEKSFIANVMIDHTPFLSNFVNNFLGNL